MIYKVTKQRLEASFLKSKLTSTVSIFLLASSCGKTKKYAEVDFDGIIDTYSPPKPVYTAPDSSDLNLKPLKTSISSPYWVDALIMDNWQNQVLSVLEANDYSMLYAFPNLKPGYLTDDFNGWKSPNDKIIKATREIFSNINEVLDIQFNEALTTEGTNIVSISQSLQEQTAGISYFPNNYFLLGSDVFISTDYSNPEYISASRTNYDYEVLIHEIGHALGLKHPFEAQGNNIVVLTQEEDTTEFTVMSYTDYSNTFDGTFRALDWMALTKLYGVNANFKNSDDTYYFSPFSGVFIIDGGGEDVIDASTALVNVAIDLRPGSHSFLGEKMEEITAANQLSISHNTQIENVYCGQGNDYIIANDGDNVIIAGSGDDRIFLGEGEDIVFSGMGFDTIDLSEDLQSKDTVHFSEDSLGDGFDTIFGFVQGLDGDVLDVSELIQGSVDLLPVVFIDSLPSSHITSHIVRLVGQDLNSVEGLKNEIEDDINSGNFKVVDDRNIMVLTSASVDTGYDQQLFCMQKSGESLDLSHLATFEGNYLDIEMWEVENFSNTIIDILV